MMMTDGEICASFRDAKNRRKQIKILAELNDCKTDKIVDILNKYGYSTKYIVAKTAPKRKTPAPKNSEENYLGLNKTETQVVLAALTELLKVTEEKKELVDKQVEALNILIDKCYAREGENARS